MHIIHLASQLPDTIEGRVIRNQTVKSGSSIGANYREANRARSKADFLNRISICESEASETQYCLEIIKDLKQVPEKLIDTEYNESSELLALFIAIGKKGKQK